MPINANVFIAAYNGNKLIEMKKVTLIKGEGSVNVNTDDATLYKAFVWINLKPLCQSAFITQ